jgi:hypothetical protein
MNDHERRLSNLTPWAAKGIFGSRLIPTYQTVRFAFAKDAE